MQNEITPARFARNWDEANRCIRNMNRLANPWPKSKRRQSKIWYWWKSQFCGKPMKAMKYLARIALPLILCLLPQAGRAYTLTYPLSPDDASGAITQYCGIYCYPTNLLGSNVWYQFGTAAAGKTNIPITSQVPSPAWLAVQSVGTNWLLSSPTNIVLYNTNALALVYTNTPTPPRAPGTPALSYP